MRPELVVVPSPRLDFITSISERPQGQVAEHGCQLAKMVDLRFKPALPPNAPGLVMFSQLPEGMVGDLLGRDWTDTVLNLFLPFNEKRLSILE